MANETGMIERIFERWGGCQSCQLHAGRNSVVVGAGPVPAPLMLIGEGPGQTEDLRGLPFVGDAGQLLRRSCRERGVDVDGVFITNLVACRPPGNRTPLPPELEACRPRLQALVAAVQPKVIVLLGGSALIALTGRTGITRNRGKWIATEWVWRFRKREIATLATFHPAGLLPGRLRSQSDLAAFGLDLKHAWDRATA